MKASAADLRWEYEEAKTLFASGDEYEAALDAAVLALMVEAVKKSRRYEEPTVIAFCQILLKGEELEKPR